MGVSLWPLLSVGSHVRLVCFPLTRRDLRMLFIQWIQQFRRDRLEHATNSNNELRCPADRPLPNQCRRFIKDSTRFSDSLIHLFCKFNIFDLCSLSLSPQPPIPSLSPR